MIDPEKFKLKILVIATNGFGKTQFLGTVPNIGMAAVETGDGKGLATIANLGVDYVTPENYGELEAFASGIVFPKHAALGLDSLSTAVTSFIKSAALAIPRTNGQSTKRSKGIPELDDYGVMGELTRQLLQTLINQNKHVIVTALLRIDKPDPENGQGGMLIGPALPGQMFLGAPAMFDVVLIGKAQEVVEKDAQGKAHRVIKRYWLTANDGVYLAKSRLKNLRGGDVLAPMEPYNLETGEGTFPYFYNRVKQAYTETYQARMASK